MLITLKSDCLQNGKYAGTIFLNVPQGYGLSFLLIFDDGSFEELPWNAIASNYQQVTIVINADGVPF